MTDGVLLLDKPVGLSSNAALQRARRALGARKAGHAGTLDPLASGLLVLLFGEATKFAQFGLDADKEYEAAVRLGAATDTGDAEGAVTGTGPARAESAALARALAGLRGEITQVPPMHSALKHRGRPLYELARAGQSVAREPRRVRIDALELLGHEGDTLRLRIRCSKGTYIRTLAEDLGRALGTCAHLAALRRTGSGRFGVDGACALEALEALAPEARRARLLPPDSLLAELPSVALEPALAERFLEGQTVRLGAAAPAVARIYGAAGALLGVGQGDAAGALKPLRLVARG